MSTPSSPVTNPLSDLSSRNLAKTIFRAEVPEQYVRTFPAQSLFLAIKQNGLHSSTDLIEIATIEQCRLFLDLDLWEHDRFHEDNFWDWLSLTDEDNTLKLLQKFLKFVDLKLIGMLIAKYVEVRIFEEPTESPPEANFLTPDKGHTWVRINIEDNTRNFLLARLLAMLFETNADLYYQMLSLPSISTYSNLEEESYGERTKRLASEGIPTPDIAIQTQRAYPLVQALQDIKAKASRDVIADVAVIEPLVYTTGGLEPFTSLLKEILALDEFQAEFTYLTNAAIVHWGVEFYDTNEVSKLVQRVKGTLNIGLELLMEGSHESARQIYTTLGLQKIYRVGLERLFALRKRAVAFKESGASNERELLLLALRQRFPEVPTALGCDGKFITDEGRLSTETRPIERNAEVVLVEGML